MQQLACQARQSLNGWRVMLASTNLSRISKNMPPTPYTVSNLELMSLQTQILVWSDKHRSSGRDERATPRMLAYQITMIRRLVDRKLAKHQQRGIR